MRWLWLQTRICCSTHMSLMNISSEINALKIAEQMERKIVGVDLTGAYAVWEDEGWPVTLTKASEGYKGNLSQPEHRFWLDSMRKIVMLVRRWMTSCKREEWMGSSMHHVYKRSIYYKKTLGNVVRPTVSIISMIYILHSIQLIWEPTVSHCRNIIRTNGNLRSWTIL